VGFIWVYNKYRIPTFWWDIISRPKHNTHHFFRLGLFFHVDYEDLVSYPRSEIRSVNLLRLLSPSWSLVSTPVDPYCFVSASVAVTRLSTLLCRRWCSFCIISFPFWIENVHLIRILFIGLTFYHISHNYLLSVKVAFCLFTVYDYLSFSLTSTRLKKTGVEMCYILN
jgi:hypothetical protein